MGNRASKVVKQFPKTPTNSGNQQPLPHEQTTQPQPNSSLNQDHLVQPESYELTEEEIKEEQEREEEMRKYLNSLQELSTSITEEHPDPRQQLIVPEGVILFLFCTKDFKLFTQT